MQKQIKQIMIYLLTGLLIVSSLGFSFQHLECNHCDVFSFVNVEKEKPVMSDCCSHHSESTTSFSDSENICACAHDVFLTEQQKGEKTTPPVLQPLSVVLFPCIITLYNILRTNFVPGIKHVIPFDSCIVFGRQILSLNAVLLI